jgi:hypothetical protein
MVKPFLTYHLPAAHAQVRQPRDAADLPHEDVLHVALRTTQDFSDFLDGQDVRCVFHVPSALYASPTANRDADLGRRDRAHTFIGILGALGDQRLFGILGDGQKGPFTPRRFGILGARRHARGLVENGVLLGKLGADLVAFFGILGANRRQSRGI